MMLDNLPAILALDPGGTTGYCYWEPVPDGSAPWQRMEQGQLENPDHHLELYNFLLWHATSVCRVPVLHIVCESFEFRKTERHRDFINYQPREYIGVAQLFVQKVKQDMKGFIPDVKLYIQMAGNVKPFWTDDKVKRLGLWVPGRKHAMDATRHYLYHRVFTLGDKSILQLLR